MGSDERTDGRRAALRLLAAARRENGHHIGTILKYTLLLTTSPPGVEALRENSGELERFVGQMSPTEALRDLAGEEGVADFDRYLLAAEDAFQEQVARAMAADDFEREFDRAIAILTDAETEAQRSLEDLGIRPDPTGTWR